MLAPVAVVAAVLIPVLVAVAALTLPAAPPGGRAGGPGAKLTLRDELAVLRRPQLRSDLTNRVRGTAQATLVRGLMRRVLVHPAGPTRSPVVSLQLIVSVASRPGAPQQLTTYLTRATGRGSAQMSFGGPVTAAQLWTQGLVTSLGSEGLAVVVPDPVATVVFAAPGTGAVTVHPQDNVAALQPSTATADTYAAHMTMRWYDADGRLIRRVGPSPKQPVPQRDIAPTRVVRALPSPSSAPLRSVLEVLRRPQTAADLALPAAHTPSFSSPTEEAMTGTPEYGLMRLAGTTAWGQRLFLLPYRPPTRHQIDALPSRLRAQARRQAPRAEELFFFLATGNGGQIGTAADVAAGRALIEYGGGVQAGKVLPLQLILVVPDGVRSVGFEIAQPGGTRLHRVPVRGNVATLEVGTAPPTNPQQIIWYGRDARLLRRYRPAGR